MSSHVDISKQVNRGVAWSSVGQTIIAIFDIVSIIWVTSTFLTTEQVGIATIARVVYAVLDVAAELGVTAALIQRDDHSPEKISTAFWFNVIMACGLTASLFVVGPVMGAIYDSDAIRNLIIAYGARLLLSSTYSVSWALLRKHLQFEEIAKIRTVAYVTESITLVVTAANGCGYWSFFLAIMARVVVVTVAMWTRHPYVPQRVFKFGELKPYIAFGMRSSSTQLLYQAYTNADYLIAGLFFGKGPAGVYYTAYNFILDPVRIITNVISDIAFPTFARLRQRPRQLVEQFITFSRLNLIAVFAFLSVICVCAHDLLRQFYAGGTWSAADIDTAATCIRILCLVGVLRALGFLGPPLLDGIGRPGLSLRYMICAAIVVPGGIAISAVVLGPSVGVLSTAIGWAAFYPLAFVVLCFLVVKAIDLPLLSYFARTWRIAIWAGIATGCGLAVDLSLGSLAPWQRMIPAALVTVVVLGALYARFEGVTPKKIKASMARAEAIGETPVAGTPALPEPPPPAA